MPPISSRVPFSVQRPYRPVRPATSKIVFLSLEGAVTEHEYFERVSELFNRLKNKLQFISVTEDAVNTNPANRTPDQIKQLSSVRPLQLVQRIEKFKEECDFRYEFAKHPDDEFWIVTDVDDNWSEPWSAEWNDAIRLCEEQGYHYAISNPFFEVWLLLHHDDPTDDDKSFAVTDEKPHQKTDHFRKRLRDLHAPLDNKKHIRKQNYSEENIRVATERAKSLHTDRANLAPHYFSSTVYLLLDELLSLANENTSNVSD